MPRKAEKVRARTPARSGERGGAPGGAQRARKKSGVRATRPGIGNRLRRARSQGAVARGAEKPRERIARTPKSATRKRAPVRPPKVVRARGKRGGLPITRALGVAAVERALATLRGKVKPGPIRVGQTRRITPTKAGFRALDRMVSEVTRAQRVRKRAAAFTVNLKIRLRGPDGRYVSLPPLEGIGLPLSAEVAARRRKGESDAAAFKRLSEETLRRAVFRQADIMFGDYRQTRAGRTWESARLAGDWKKARRALKRIKAQRDLTFQVELVRQVTAETGEDEET